MVCLRGRGILIVSACAAALGMTACGASPAAPTPTPVAVVDGVPVSRELFDIRVTTTLTAIRQGGGAVSASAEPAMEAKVRASVMRSLIFDAVVAEEAARLRVAASDSDVENELQSDASQAGGTDPLQTELAAAGGSLAQLRDAIRSRLMEERLEDRFASQRASDIEARLATGVDFGSLAKDLSDDEQSSPAGGSLGVLGAADIQRIGSDLATAIGRMGPGQISSPIRDQAGYEIVQVTAVTAKGRAVRRILVAAPMPYTVRERPQWFADAVYAAISDECSRDLIRVLLPGAEQVCVAASPTASPSPSSSASASVASGH